LIDDLLSYSRIGRSQPDQQHTDLNDLVAEVLATLGPAIDERSGVVRVSGNLPTVQADRTMLFEVLSNLICNGLKFNDSHTPTVEIGVTEAESSDTQEATVFVRDNGIGIADEHHDAVFTMFRRLHSRRKYEGTGAGLSIVRKIIEAHGGHVWVESTLGQGATFYFTLPKSSSNLSPESPENHCAYQELAASAAG
jgi:light-regulated signal transduction histidine kinase (bacteriophytochrome)